MKFRNKKTGQELTIEEPAATVIRDLNNKIEQLKAKLEAYESATKKKREDIPDFLRGFGRK